ncbi:LLM class flavin-dependent oxidoreductase [Streptomyces sp. N50]|uniref:LLM class flavin-dependent oxidoreductase n=1 Tax=Streptomyces sp. N50 TaxID=3081765 RepID=UPI0029620453|nr:LLM class flavin-dependent oxidoreductase [Streptomyces sp. N50]WOX15253.1 LLM class flavin-dependent oxidoreductase [Streptomyces sp. N50]
MTITSLAFLTPGDFADDDPCTGLEETLQLFEYGERLGYDGAWIRQRHLEHGVGSAAVFLAAGRGTVHQSDGAGRPAVRGPPRRGRRLSVRPCRDRGPSHPQT